MPMLKIAIPVVMAELGWMAMGVVDTVMVGGIGPEAISAAGVSNSIHIAFAIFGMAIMLGLDTLVSQAYGARDIRDCHRWFFDGLILAGLLTVPIMALLILVWFAIPFLGFHSAVRPMLQSYYGVLILSTPFLLGYAVCRRYLQGIHAAMPVMFALVTANLINAAGNWVLIYGHLGFPALGVSGSAWATVISRAYMLASLLLAVWWMDRRRMRDAHIDDRRGLWHVDRAFNAERLKRLLALGLPAASQVAAEVGVFAIVTALSGMLDPISSASHQIALNMAGVAFMIPLGLGSAGAVRVGHAVGARDPARASAAGWTAILLAILFMVASGLTFVLVPRQLISLFSSDVRVLEAGTSLLLLAAIFQLFDGIQGVITGTLRGLGDTHTAMKVNLVAHWLFGLPTSYLLCFVAGWGVWGLWIGLSVGLIVTGVILFWVWTTKIAHYLSSASLITRREMSS
ncbi:MAG TPA: MATE family efflux transporter [Vicinamibacterales bacterium]|nr:MATE family efflux transporter [Vicinamibacterales bacterium]